MQENYNKKIAPFSFDKINNVNIPVNINVSMSVIDIIKIAEVTSGDDDDDYYYDDDGDQLDQTQSSQLLSQVDHTYTLKYRLILEW